MIRPYHNDAVDTIYNCLFCDMPSLFVPETKVQKEYPWNVLLNESASNEEVLSLITDATVESRVKLLGYNKLRAGGYDVQKKELLGIIVEVGLDNGLDVLAAYKDGTARYINQVGKMIIWETKTSESDMLINNLFSAALPVVSRIGAWENPRTSEPRNNEIRINFLVADGLYFGQGPADALANDAMGGPVIHAATQLLVFLTDKTMNDVNKG